jgi:hypothetical protein
MPTDHAGSWNNRDFHDEVPRRRRLRERGLTAGLVTVAAFAVFLVAIQHEITGCRDACYDNGLRTYEGGHVWTAYDGSWQWQAQWLLGLLALVLGAASLATSTRMGLRRRTTALLSASLAASVLWILWRVLEPAIPS